MSLAQRLDKARILPCVNASASLFFKRRERVDNNDLREQRQGRAQIPVGHFSFRSAIAVLRALVDLKPVLQKENYLSHSINLGE
jgi:hypothetical protein